ncbi:hypothetical protein [Gloeobacter violaceus]|uniref:hypothetical protein n=1 Tax=Gloeobacter violaceus TaxID=33072 RepID=UPI0013E8CD56|nr:hypothetical protein [Gloeobacter violaceus]
MSNMSSSLPVDPGGALTRISEVPDWILPTASELYKRRKDIQTVFKKVSELFGRKTIVFLGMKGVGKTVLLDYVTGKAYDRGYSPPMTSTKIEEGREGRLVLRVIPGKETRYMLESELFLEETKVDGVVYVVANGFASIRNELAKASLIEDQNVDTLERYRELQLSSELHDLKGVCELLRSSIRRNQKPTWMVVAVTKVDLFYNFAVEAAKYYSPYGNSQFVKTLHELQHRVGSDNFTWSALPVCGWLEDFTWNNQTQGSVLKGEQRDHFEAAFVYLPSMCCSSRSINE